MFNLGGPDRLSSVEPFLFNLFYDRAIIDLPNPFRWALAKFISSRRKAKAISIYEKIGGKSPIVEMTNDQVEALEEVLNTSENSLTCKVFVVMRYWHPMSDEVAGAVKDYDPDEIILLPLYPQYSTTTTGSSIMDWGRAARAAKIDVPTKPICCYPTQPDWIDAQCKLINQSIEKMPHGAPMRVLFSAHGLPQKIIDKGDPYQWQVEKTVGAIVETLTQQIPGMPVEHRLCYQSRVGRLEWIGPSIDDEIKRAAQDGVNVVVVPVAFVSEHSETLVELDMDYAIKAYDLGIKQYERVPAVGTHPDFMAGLANLVEGALKNNKVRDCECGSKQSQCPHKNARTNFKTGTRLDP